MKIKAKNRELLSQIQSLEELTIPSGDIDGAYLKYRQGLTINRKRIYRLMKENKLLVMLNTRLKAIRADILKRSKPKAARINQYWGIDMTKVLIQSFGWLYLIIILDWFSNLKRMATTL